MLFDDLPHDTLTPEQSRRKTKAALQVASWEALECLRRSVQNNAATSEQIRAAIAILDRSGFGQQSSLIVEDQRTEFADLSPVELRARANKLVEAIDKLTMELPTHNTIQ